MNRQIDVRAPPVSPLPRISMPTPDDDVIDVKRKSMVKRCAELAICDK